MKYKPNMINNIVPIKTIIFAIMLKIDTILILCID